MFEWVVTITFITLCKKISSVNSFLQPKFSRLKSSSLYIFLSSSRKGLKDKKPFLRTILTMRRSRNLCLTKWMSNFTIYGLLTKPKSYSFGRKMYIKPWSFLEFIIEKTVKSMTWWTNWGVRRGEVRLNNDFIFIYTRMLVFLSCFLKKILIFLFLEQGLEACFPHKLWQRSFVVSIVEVLVFLSVLCLSGETFFLLKREVFWIFLHSW